MPVRKQQGNGQNTGTSPLLNENLAMVTKHLGRVDTNHINNESELDKSCEHDIEFFKSGEDAPKSF